MNIGDRVQLRSGELGTVADNYVGDECWDLRIDLDAGGSRVVDQEEVTPAGENKTWWIVLTPALLGELNGVLVTDEGDRVHTLMGPEEARLVTELARYANPTVDVSVAHGWGQAPPGMEEQYRLRKAVR